MVDKQEANHTFGQRVHEAVQNVEKTFEKIGHSVHESEKSLAHNVEQTAHKVDSDMHAKFDAMLKGLSGTMEHIRNSVGHVHNVGEVQRGAAGYAAIAHKAMDAAKHSR